MSARGELILERKAVVDCWPITADARSALVVRATGLALLSGDDRTAVAALRVLVAMQNANLEHRRYDDARALESRVGALEEQLRGVAGAQAGEAGEAGAVDAPPPAPAVPLPR